MARDEITWSMFDEQGVHQWVYDDEPLKSRYAIRSADGMLEISIRAKLTTDPTPDQIKEFLRVVNAFRVAKRSADRLE